MLIAVVVAIFVVLVAVVVALVERRWCRIFRLLCPCLYLGHLLGSK